MRYTAHLVRFPALFGLALSLTWPGPSVAQPGPPVNAGQPSSQQLHAPADRESFDFMMGPKRSDQPEPADPPADSD